MTVDPPRRSLSQQLRDVLLSGLMVVVPILATILVVAFSVSFLANLLDPVVVVLEPIVPSDWASVSITLLAVGVVLAIVVVVGVLIERAPAADVPKRHVDSTLGQLPVVGTIYTSFVEVSEAFLRPDEDEFESVKLVEMDVPDRYAIAFKTSETPATIQDATGCGEMETLFVPSAPNPLIGGDVTYVTSDRVVDVDMTVEEGIRAVVTSGTADAPERLQAAQPDGSVD